MKKGYVAVGLVRGWCGHVHRTLEAAQQCVEEDQRRMNRLPGNAYSDRRVYAAEDLPTRGGEYYLPTHNAPHSLDAFKEEEY